MGSGRTEMVRALFGLAAARAGRVRPGTEARRRRPARARPEAPRGLRLPQRGPQGRGARAAALGGGQRHPDPPLVLLSRRRPRPPPAARAGRGARPSSSACGCAGRPSPCARCPAGTSRRPRSRGSSTRKRTCSCSTSRRAASTWRARPQLYQAIARAADAGRAVLMVSSYVPELLGVCDRVAVMSRGRLSPARPVAEWTPERDARGGDRVMTTPWRQRVVRLGPFLGLLLVIAFFAVASGAPERYLSTNNLRVVLAQTVIVAIGAIGMTLVIVGGGIDLVGRVDDRAHRRPLRARPAGRLAPARRRVPRGPGRRRRRPRERPRDHAPAGRSLHRDARHAGRRPGHGEVARQPDDGERAADVGERARGHVPPGGVDGRSRRACGSPSCSPS